MATKAMFSHMSSMAKKGKKMPMMDEHEPDGDSPAKEKQEGNTEAPGPKMSKPRFPSGSLNKAKAKADSVSEDAREGIEGKFPDAEDSAEEKGATDKGKVAKKKSRFGRHGSPIQI